MYKYVSLWGDISASGHHREENFILAPSFKGLSLRSIGPLGRASWQEHVEKEKRAEKRGCRKGPGQGRVLP